MCSKVCHLLTPSRQRIHVLSHLGTVVDVVRTLGSLRIDIKKVPLAQYGWTTRSRRQALTRDTAHRPRRCHNKSALADRKKWQVILLPNSGKPEFPNADRLRSDRKIFFPCSFRGASLAFLTCLGVFLVASRSLSQSKDLFVALIFHFFFLSLCLPPRCSAFRRESTNLRRNQSFCVWCAWCMCLVHVPGAQVSA